MSENEYEYVEEEDVNEEEDEQQQTKNLLIPESLERKKSTKRISKDAKTLYKQYNTKYQPLLQYPFKSKVQYVEQYIRDRQEPFVHDFQLKPVKKLSKPNFSRTPGCWEIDVMFAKHFTNTDKDITYNDIIYNGIAKQQTIYLVLLNVNTRYLIVLPVKDKNQSSYIDAIKKHFNKGLIDKGKYEYSTGPRGGKYKKLRPDSERYINNSKLKTIKGDGEFDTKMFKTFCSNYGIKLIIDDSPYTLAHKSIDAVIRTLRNAFGLNDNRIADNKLMQQMVKYYNNTPHRSLKFRNYNIDDTTDNDKRKWIYYTPYQVYTNSDLEWRYIRMMMNKLLDIKKQQKSKGLLSYKPGNIILIHLDKGKTQKKHEKRRRVFNEIAEFINYDNGNVRCRILKRYYQLINIDKKNKLYVIDTSYKDEKSIITVPIIYTKYVCSSYKQLSNEYIQYFDLV